MSSQFSQEEKPAPQFAVVGIVGGVGSGKSAVSRWVSSQIPVVAIDADRVGHQVLTSELVKQQLVQNFGPGILGPSGEIERPRLGALVWGETFEQVQARRKLESIVHPVIRQQISQQIEAAKQNHQWGVLLDAAVMLESGWSRVCDSLIFVDVPDKIRLQRVMENRGWTQQQWQERENSQFSVDEKRKRADFVVDNSGNVEQAGDQLLGYLKEKYGWS